MLFLWSSILSAELAENLALKYIAYAEYSASSLAGDVAHQISHYSLRDVEFHGHEGLEETRAAPCEQLSDDGDSSLLEDEWTLAS